MNSNATISKDNFSVSFIIPAFNEEKNIGRLFESIDRYCSHIPHEVILVDNGSTDRTRDIGEENHAFVLCEPDINVAELRNRGASHAKGRFYIFLDGDIELTPQWSSEIQNTLEALDETPTKFITGSRCSAPDEKSFLEKYWFTHKEEQNYKYINSAHLIIHSLLFTELNGFDPNLVSGEDTDLSERARKEKGTLITNNARLKVIHHGYPKNLFNFVKREAWHGVRTNKLLDVICCSTVQFATDIYLLLHIFLLISVLAGLKIIALGILLLIVLLLLASSLYKYSYNIKLAIINSFIFYFYYLGRSISVINVILHNTVRKRQPRGR
jgi:glycosyltransferase involved in cell wall biosynthesis